MKKPTIINSITIAKGNIYRQYIYCKDPYGVTVLVKTNRSLNPYCVSEEFADREIIEFILFKGYASIK